MSRGLEIDDIELLADRLAGRLKTSRNEAIKIALENELKRIDDPRPLRERLQPLFDRIDARPRGPDADKAFYDSLNDE